MSNRFDLPAEFDRDPELQNLRASSNESSNLDLEVERMQAGGAMGWGFIGMFVALVGTTTAAFSRLVQRLLPSHSNE